MCSRIENQAGDAIRHIGTNAIPCLLRWIRYDPPPWKATWYQTLAPLVRRLNPNWELRDKDDDRAASAMAAFQTLGPAAAGAVEALGRLSNAHHFPRFQADGKKKHPKFG